MKENLMIRLVHRSGTKSYAIVNKDTTVGEMFDMVSTLQREDPDADVISIEIPKPKLRAGNMPPLPAGTPV